MAKINPEMMKSIFSQDILDALPSDKEINRTKTSKTLSKNQIWKDNVAKSNRDRAKNPTCIENRNKAMEKRRTISKELHDKIYAQCWTEDRSEKKRRQLASEFNVLFCVIKRISEGRHSWTDKEQYAKDKEEWIRNHTK